MSGNTPRYGIPYPTNNDAVDVPGDMQNLAEYLDTTVLPSLVTGDNVIPITVDAGVVVNAGDPFYIVGETTLATVPPKFAWKVERSLSTDPTTLPAVGIANENVLADALSYGTIVGPVDAELDTGSFPLGTVLYVGNSTALTGYNLTSTPPSPTEQLQRVAVVTKSDNSTGSITFIPSDIPRVRLDTDQTWDGSQTFVGDTTVPDRPPLDTESNAANTRYVQNELARYGPLIADNVWIGNNTFLAGVDVVTLPVGDASTNAANALFVQNELEDHLQYYARLDGATFTGEIFGQNATFVSVSGTNANFDNDVLISNNLDVLQILSTFNLNVQNLGTFERLVVNNTFYAPGVMNYNDSGLLIGSSYSSSTSQISNSLSTPSTLPLSIIYTPKNTSSKIELSINLAEVTKNGNSTGARIVVTVNGVPSYVISNNAGNNSTSSTNNIGNLCSIIRHELNPTQPIAPINFGVTIANSSNNQGSVSVGGNSTISSLSIKEFAP